MRPALSELRCGSGTPRSRSRSSSTVPTSPRSRSTTFTSTFPKIDVVGDGFVLVGARCTRPSATTLAELEAEIPRNGRITGADGTTLTTFHTGDGIEQLMSDHTGNIWIGYFDEAAHRGDLPVERR
jgi:hypothetical protein